jgi:hypothetical protein
MAVVNTGRAIPPGRASARKRHALELFAGLPRHCDRIAVLFSFGQDPRWRRTMVRAIGPSVEDRVLRAAPVAITLLAAGPLAARLP